VLLDMLEMVFAKADPRVVKVYERHLVAPELQPLGDDLLRRYDDAQGLLLRVMKHSGLLSSQSTAFLQAKLQLRAPYVAPLNILQVYCLKTLRQVEAGRPVEEVAVGYTPDEGALALMSRGGSHPFIAAVEDTM
jgi:phosphoenolpyruvate carboxylase